MTEKCSKCGAPSDICAVYHVGCLQRQITALIDHVKEAEQERRELHDTINHWRVKAECYGNMVAGCSPALEAAGFPVDCSAGDGAVGGVKRAVEAMYKELVALKQERDELRADIERRAKRAFFQKLDKRLVEIEQQLKDQAALITEARELIKEARYTRPVNK